jgi:nucleotide-binding universal stress UspA family protein
MAAGLRGRRRAPAPDWVTGRAGGYGVLLASEGRAFSREAVREAATLARRHDGRVRVLIIARMHGTGFGLPHPGLKPNSHEMAAYEEHVAKAIAKLKRAGVDADGHIITTRRATRSILAEAARLGCEAIVMGADPPRNRFAADFMWSQEPYRVKRRAGIPVHIVCAGSKDGGRAVGAVMPAG